MGHVDLAYDGLRLVSVFALMVYLMRRRVDVSYALVVGAVTAGLLFDIKWEVALSSVPRVLPNLVVNLGRAAVVPDTLELVGLVLLITLLGHVLKRVASLKRLIAVLRALLRDRRVAMAVAPAFIGLLPMPGGALFSAPMVGELSDDLKAPSEDRALINYWFRHVWELTWPLYPGILIAATILAAPLDKLVLSAAPLTVAAIAIGFVLCFRRVELPAGEVAGEAAVGTWRELIASVWPVGLVVLSTIGIAVAKHAGAPLPLSTKAALLVALAVVVPLFMAAKRVGWATAGQLVKATLRPRLVVLVYGIMAFGHMLRVHHAAARLPAEFQAVGVPPVVFLFVVPFIVGLLMGYSPAYVGICLPVLKPLLVADGAVHYGYYVWAMGGGFLGVMLSPVHLCLVLSKEYFSADFGRVYRRLLLPVALLAASALATMVLWEAVGLR